MTLEMARAEAFESPVIKAEPSATLTKYLPREKKEKLEKTITTNRMNLKSKFHQQTERIKERKERKKERKESSINHILSFSSTPLVVNVSGRQSAFSHARRHAIATTVNSSDHHSHVIADNRLLMRRAHEKLSK
jgi:hypothetical protein